MHTYNPRAQEAKAGGLLSVPDHPGQRLRPCPPPQIKGDGAGAPSSSVAPFYPNPREAEAASFQVQDQPGLPSEFHDSQGYTVKPCLKKPAKQRQNVWLPEAINTEYPPFPEAPSHPPPAALAPSGSHVHDQLHSLERCRHSLCLI